MADKQQLELLGNGVEEWNAWYVENQNVQIDLIAADLHEANLSGADLHEANLSGADLRGADLSGADLREADLREADLREADLSGADLRRADLRRADLRTADLSEAYLRTADLSGGDLSEANFRGVVDLSAVNLSGVNLSGGDLSGVNLNRANLSGANLSGANLRRANLRGANLYGADLRGVDLSGVVLSGVDLSGFDLSRVNLRGADLRGVDLSGANLRGVDLSGFDLSRTNLRGANLRGANLRGVDLSGVDLSGFDLSGFDLSRTNLRGANLYGANLRGVDLSGVDLSGFDLSRANLYGANLSGCDLSGVDLSKANLRGATLMRTQVLATNFCSAVFTASCLKDWNTNSLTNLENAKADYVYLDSEGDEFSDRRPHSGNFKPGEFAALFQQALDTLDLIFVDGIDWQAFFASFQELRQQYNDADLNIQAIEKKSGGSFVVRLEVPDDVDKAAIEQSAKANYENQLQLIEARYQAQLQAKDVEIGSYQREMESYRQQSADMAAIARALANQPPQPPPIINVEANAVADKKNLVQNNSGGVNFQNDISGGQVNQGETINVTTSNNQGATIGNFANVVKDNASQNTYGSEQHQSLAELAQEIQALLEQLSEAYPTETLVQKAQLVEVAIAQVQANPSLKQKIVGVLECGEMEAIVPLLKHPAAALFVEGIQE